MARNNGTSSTCCSQLQPSLSRHSDEEEFNAMKSPNGNISGFAHFSVVPAPNRKTNTNGRSTNGNSKTISSKPGNISNMKGGKPPPQRETSTSKLPPHVTDRKSLFAKTKEPVNIFWNGLKNGMALQKTLLAFAHSRAVCIRTIQLLALNSAVVAGGLLMIRYPNFPLPLVHAVAQWFNVASFYALESDAVSTHSLSGYGSAFIVQLSDIAAWLTFIIFGMLPLYLIAFVVSTVWYNDVMKYGYKVYEQHTKSRHGNGEIGVATTAAEGTFQSQIVRMVAETVYRLLLVGVMQLQAALIELLPVVGRPLSFLFCCFLYGFIAFDYRWTLENRPLAWRVHHAELYAIWLLGFGMPITAASFFSSFFVNGGVYAALLPFMLLLAIDADRPQELWVKPVKSDSAPAQLTEKAPLNLGTQVLLFACNCIVDMIFPFRRIIQRAFRTYKWSRRLYRRIRRCCRRRRVDESSSDSSSEESEIRLHKSQSTDKILAQAANTHAPDTPTTALVGVRIPVFAVATWLVRLVTWILPHGLRLWMR